MTKDDSVYIEDIIDAFSKILTYLKDLTEQDFYMNEMVQDAVIRKFEIAGEASKNISAETKEKYDTIPWKKMSGMRDKLIHDYAGVDLLAVWEAVKNIIPGLIDELEKINKQ